MSQRKGHILPQTLRLLLRRFHTFFVAGVLAWILLSGIELWWRGLPWSIVSDTLLWLTVPALPVAAFATLLLFCVHGLVGLSWRKPVQRVGFGAAGMGLAATYPAWQQASFLTSGDAVSQRPLVGALRIGLTVLFVVATAGLWSWHAIGIAWFSAQATRGHGAGASRRRRLVWLGVGLLGGLVATRALARHLDFYAYFANALTWPVWLLVAGLLHAGLSYLLAAGHRITWPLLGTVGVAAGFVLATPALGITRAAPAKGHVARVAETLLFPPEPSPLRIDFAGAASLDCRVATPPALPDLPLPAERRRHVFLITVDTFRADMLEAEIQGRPLMPHLRAFAARSLDFRRAQSPYPATALALASMLTGLTPSQLLFSTRVPDNVFTLTRTHFDRRLAILPNDHWFYMPVIDAVYLQGTPAFHAANDEQATTQLLGELGRIDRRQQRTFAWIHYYGPHGPYEAQPGFDFGNSDRERYLSEVAALDVQLGRLLHALAEQGWFDDSLIVVTADHGEAFGEHGYYGHHVYLNGWIIDIPLLVFVPGGQAEKRTYVVSLLDVAPTVLHFLKVQAPLRWTGRSLLAGEDDRPPFVVSEAFPLRGVSLFARVNRPPATFEDLLEETQTLQDSAIAYQPKVSLTTRTHRLIVDRETGSAELFDTVQDPGENSNLATQQPALLQELQKRLAEWHAQQSHAIYCAAREQR